MHRFFISPSCIERNAVYFPMEVSRQIATVLHLKAGQKVIALDNSGSEYEVELEIVAPRTTEGRVLASRPAQSEPRTRLELYLGLTQREKFEWMLQKCTEVGAAGFTPLITSRSLVQSAEEAHSKQERWQRILQEAAEQSGRGVLPLLRPALRWEEALAQLRVRGLPGLVAWEGETALRIPQALAQIRQAGASSLPLGVFIGPEGGLSEAEVALARDSGVLPVTLGRRVLRMETAAVVAAAIILHELGD